MIRPFKTIPHSQSFSQSPSVDDFPMKWSWREREGAEEHEMGRTETRHKFSFTGKFTAFPFYIPPFLYSQRRARKAATNKQQIDTPHSHATPGVKHWQQTKAEADFLLLLLTY